MMQILSKGVKVGVILMILMNQCAQERFWTGGKNGEKLKIAVLHFAGKGINRDMKYLAADYLSSQFYLHKKIPIVDRSQVNEIARVFNIENPYFLSKQQLCSLADTLDSDIMVLGNIIFSPDQTELDKTSGWLGITLRFLDGTSGDVLFILYRNVYIPAPSYNQIRRILDEMVSRL